MNMMLQNRGQRAFDRIVIGLFFHLLGQASYIISNEYVMAVICSVGWIYIIRGAIYLGRHLSYPFKGGYRFLYSVFVFLTLIMIFRGYFIDYPYPWLNSFEGMINTHLFIPTYIICYLMPLVALIPCEYYSFGHICKLSVMSWIVFIVLIPFFLSSFLSSSVEALVVGRYLENPVLIDLTALSFSITFLILCNAYIPQKSVIIGIVGVVLGLLIVLIGARRGGIFTLGCVLLAYLYSLFEKKNKQRGKLLLLFIPFLMALYFVSNNFSETFSFVQERGLEDTRSGVDDALLSQMNEFEMLFGKGLNGRYYYPVRDLSEDNYNGYRYGSETGFMNLALKGGFIYAIIYVLLLLIPSMKGVFHSRNLLCKVLGIFIIISLLELYPHGWLRFDVKFLVIWMGVRLCMLSKYRNMNNKEIYQTFFALK